MKAFFRTESLAACVVVASLALPSGAWAQRRATAAVTDGAANVASIVAPERPFPVDTLDAGRTSRLGDAMAEAYRGPFHAAARAPGLATGGSEAGVTAVRIPFSGGLVPDSTGGSPSFHTVFWPTLLTAFLSDLGAFYYLVLTCSYDCGTSSAVGAVSTAILAPALVARSFGKGTWKNIILGSTIGLGLGIAVGIAVGIDTPGTFCQYPSLTPW